MSLSALRCPSCSAPLPPLAAGRVTCDYCHVTSTFDASGQLRDSASPSPTGDRAGPSPFWRRLLRLLRVGAWLGFGLSTVAVPVAFQRGAPGELVALLAIALGLGTLAGLAEGQKLLVTLLCLLNGALLVAKPWAQPLVLNGEPFSPTSETACYFLFPGVALLVVGILLALSVKRADLRPGWPHASTLVLAGLGALGAVGWFAQETEAQLAASHSDEWKQLRAQVREATRGQASPTAITSGDFSTLIFEDRDPKGTNTVQFVSLAQLEAPNTDTGHYYPGGSDLLSMWRASGEAKHVSDGFRRRVADESFRATLRRARATRFVVAYRAGEGVVEVFLYDRELQALRLRERVPCANPNGIIDGPEAVLGVLGALPGAQVSNP
ncbi:MAG: hypothetical protein JKY65_13935 [Planctomycetes bacterium]|nr:hypothetical protein [Planctomycetota bacterium]